MISASTEFKNSIEQGNHRYLLDIDVTTKDTEISSASGTIASFADGADGLPMESVVAHIEPVQSGTGDPSPTNVRPISGWTGANVHHLKKNLFLANASGGSSVNISFVRNEDGSLTFSGQANGTTRTPTLGNVTLPAGTYIVNGITGGSENTYGLRVSKIVGGSTEILDTFYSGESIFTIEEETIIRLTGRFSNVQTTAYSVTMYPMIRPAVITDGAYEPYNGTVYTVDWTTEAGTVYGGTVDLVSGKLVVDRVSNTIDGSQEISNNGIQPYGGLQIRYIPSPPKKAADSAATQNYGVLSDRFDSSLAFPNNEWQVTGRSINQYLYFNMPSTITTAQQARTWFESNPTQVVYLLENPIVYDLTPQEITSLFGINNVWADTGDIEIEYTANIKIPIINEEKIVEFSVEDAVSDDEKFSSLGGVVIGLATIVLDNTDETFTEYKFKDAIISIKLGLIISQGTSSISEYINYGIYNVDSVDYIGNRIRLLCLDNMVKFDDHTFSETLLTQFPITIQQIVDDACSVCGVTSQGVVPHASEYLNVRPSGEVTYREILQSIAQLTGTFAKINKQGRLYFNWFDVTHLNQAYNDGTIIPNISNVIYLDGDKIASIVPQQHNTMITGVKADIVEGEDLVEYIAGTDEFVIDISNNIFIESINVQTILNRIYTDISGLVIRGLTMKHLNNPLYESGDVGITAYKIDRLNSNALQYCPFVITRTVFAINKLQETVCGIESDTNSNRSATRDKIYLQTARQINEYDKTLDTEEVFNRLTNNGEAEGIFYEDGQIYINMSYLATGIISLGGRNNEAGQLVVFDEDNVFAAIINGNSMRTRYYRESPWLRPNSDTEYRFMSLNMWGTRLNFTIYENADKFLSGEGIMFGYITGFSSYDTQGNDVIRGISINSSYQGHISAGNELRYEYNSSGQASVAGVSENRFWGTEYHYGNTTYAGILTIPKMESNQRAYIIKNLHMEIDSPPSEDILSGSFCFTDINAESLGAIDFLQKDNGQNVTRIMSWTKINDTYYYHGLGIGVDSTGNPVVIMFGNSGSGPAAWRSAINAVNKSGDTLSGNFRFVVNESGSQTLAIQSKNIELGVTPATAAYSGRLRFGDTDNALLGYVDAEYSTAKRSLIRMLGYNVIGGTQYYSGFGVGVDANGNASVVLYSNVSGTSPSTAWRTAIGAVNKAGDIMTGILSVQKNSDPYFATKNSSINAQIGQTIPSSDTIVGRFIILDSTGNSCGSIAVNKNADDSVVTRIEVRRKNSSGTFISNAFLLGINSSGNRYVTFTDPTIWRKALSIPTDFSITSVDASITVNATVASATQTTASGINTSNYKILGIVGYHVQGSDRMYLTLNEVRMDGANIKWGISNRKSSQVTATVTFKILKVAL